MKRMILMAGVAVALAIAPASTSWADDPSSTPVSRSQCARPTGTAGACASASAGTVGSPDTTPAASACGYLPSGNQAGCGSAVGNGYEKSAPGACAGINGSTDNAGCVNGRGCTMWAAGTAWHPASCSG